MITDLCGHFSQRQKKVKSGKNPKSGFLGKTVCHIWYLEFIPLLPFVISQFFGSMYLKQNQSINKKYEESCLGDLIQMKFLFLSRTIFFKNGCTEK